MFKLAVFFALVACTFAAPISDAIFGAAPVAYAAPAIGYSAYSTYNVHSAPVAYAAPAAPLVYSAHAVPLAYKAHIF